MFSTLLDNPTARHPASLQRDAKKKFPDLVSRSKLVKRKPDSIIGAGTVVVLAVATYSLRDLKLLDEIDNRSDEWSKREITIQVFDIVKCKSHSDVARYLPIGQRIDQTPAIAIWENQVLQLVKQGEHAARNALKSYNVL